MHIQQRIDKEDKEMRYVVMDQVKNGDLFTDEFDSLDEAVTSAEYDWNHLSEHDKNQREKFFVLESVNPDIFAENHLDGEVIKRWK